jgi:NAD(P)-dependent dehydrogenase (short-subunit alcohol dehydrogenase family)
MSILVTGGSKGIGRAIALRFATPGNHVFVNYAHDADAARATAEEIEQQGARASVIREDVGTAEGCARLVAQVAEQTERLDQLVHCAVYPVSSSVLDISPDDFQKAVQLNGAAILYLTQAARPLLARGSSVFFISSRGSKVSVPGYIGVGAPKALAEAIIRYLAVDLAPLGVRANTVSAGPLLTDAFRAAVPQADERFAMLAERNPSGRNLEFDDVTAAVEFLASPAASMINGQELFIDGGLFTKS